MTNLQRTILKIVSIPLLCWALLLGVAALSSATAQGERCEGRLISHAMGESCVPDAPQRVVVLDTGELDSALALGVKPVGAVTAFGGGTFLEYLDTDGITPVGTIADPNLEAILALQPDLILSSRLRHESIYDQLSRIAPTVFTETVGVVWQDNLLVHGEALGRGAEARELLSDYFARAATLRDGLGTPLPEISVVRFLPNQIRLYQRASFIGTILEDVGLPRPDAQDVDDFAAIIGDEGIPAMDGDVIFVTTYGPRQDTDYARVTDTPLWENLDAVEADNVYNVPDDYWMLGIGIGAANLVLDDLETFLLEGQD
ncbi:MAG: iron-siderophore ABC transporter substrate-binding protein [Trueperaceae bacterium]|nr:iron-siderophore ABC transporter substrate-binding protein [Trueperaceae bacterium]